MSRLGNVKVFDNNISRLFNPNAEVGQEIRKITRRIIYTAIAISPRRSNVLASSFTEGGVLKSGKYAARGQAGNSAPHASFVFLGTGQYDTTGRGYSRDGIRSTRPDGLMSVPRYRGSIERRPREKVNGQRPNDILSKAALRVLSSYGVK